MPTQIPFDFETDLFINGAYVPSASGARFTTPDPATGKPLASIASASEADVNNAVENALEAFNSGSWSLLEPQERGAVLLKFATLIERELDELAILEAVDAGKPITDCKEFDFPDVLNSIRFYAEAADKFFGKVVPTGETTLGLIVREPVGVVGAVLPWNFPAAMLAWKLAPALAAGNSIVVKPPELSSLTTLRLAQLALDAGVPAGVFNVVPGRGEIAGKALGLHPKVAAISFTGSEEVGRQFLQYSAASNLKNVTLEMGGKSAQIVMPSWAGDLETVATDLIEAAFGNNGQNCTAGSLILVHEELKDELLGRLKTVAESKKVGLPLDPESDYSALIEESALTRVLEFIDEAHDEGATIITGGERVLEHTGGWFVSPTIVTDVEPTSRIAQEEIFGPVTVVLGFSNEDEAIELANGTKYGLAGTVWTKDLAQANRMAHRFNAGTVSINGYSEGDIRTPFGGFKQSGFGGKDNGFEALEQFTNQKTIWINADY
ncbi:MULTISPECIES: aldehyde dehydrogenase family protein [Corynebacterium]|uniref:Aldehyde dehydrogenase n=1 Tax=Corynebacterium hadale TaxID=2026255 RepID=A0A269PBK6_9CORY|nr:aldehyde dehydrogenase family protein [Corynebacterium hadale]PAJ69074.1 aldehyde dehydrogenase [Corynebacterium hadale]WKC61295.1 Aldehyde dehydrogenase PuuC [Corynebacterium hadale]